ncbi:hypothetical protein CEXT_441661 [Caerostris extrusa]|uniref:Uncharacterized protein n=1 Tax=Caerostris extrusa TaxID=172846 RepID=A0AAV4X6L7_CAEEX|nr:hypothetical protein CEXT_441661 [Caerostris extrusa]
MKPLGNKKTRAAFTQRSFPSTPLHCSLDCKVPISEQQQAVFKVFKSAMENKRFILLSTFPNKKDKRKTCRISLKSLEADSSGHTFHKLGRNTTYIYIKKKKKMSRRGMKMEAPSRGSHARPRSIILVSLL